MSEMFNNPEDMDNIEARYASVSPCGPGTVRYAIGYGETLASIAKKFGTTVEDLIKANPRLNPNLYHSGDTLCVPDEPACKGELYTIKQGDTFFGIAQKTGVALDVLIASNPNTSPDNLIIGQRLCIPAATGPANPQGCSGTQYTVRRGDTMHLIAQWNHITLSDLIAANPGVNPEKLYVGQTLCVPKAAEKPPATAPEPVCDGQKYQVVRGDTFFLIAQKNKTTVEALQRVNPGVQPDKLTIGQIICIPAVTPPTPLCSGTKYTVKRGDTFYAIAQWNGIALSDLIAANPSVNPERLYAGQEVCIPKKEAPAPGEPQCSGAKYTISRGDTFFSIAQKNGVGIAELLAANPNVNPEKLYIGQVVCVPRKADVKPEPTCDGAKYTIAKGDTFYDISIKNGVTIQELLTANPGVNPERLYVGQVVCVPRKAAPPAPVPVPVPPNEKPCTGTKYVVVKGDTFWGVAQKLHVDLTALLAANPAVAPDKLSVGQILCVPAKASASTEGTLIKADAAPFMPEDTAVKADAIPVKAEAAADNEGEADAPDVANAATEPEEDETAMPAATAQPAPAALRPCDGVRYVIQKGDTFYTIAQKNGVSLSELLAANPGINPEKLEAGQVVCVPKKPAEQPSKPGAQPCNGVRYSVQKGDTFWAIAQWNNLELAVLLAANPGVNPEKLEAGQVICVPLKSGENGAGCNGHMYAVKKGDTLFAIAKNNSIPINDLLTANPGVVPEKLEVGQQLCIPGGGGVSPFCANGAPYVIKKGDTLYAIAIRFGLALARVLEANPTINPEKLIEGDVICLPDPQAVTPEPLCPGGTQYVIQKGDTFYALALRFGISLAAILAANPKVNPDVLEPGDVVCLPVTGPLKPFCETGTPYVIQKGDTLYALAIKFGVSLQQILAANPTLKPEKLEPGDVVCIPKKPTQPETPTPPSLPSCTGSRYVIQKGDTYFKLSQRFSVTVDQILKANPVVDPANRVGDMPAEADRMGAAPCHAGSPRETLQAQRLPRMLRRYAVLDSQEVWYYAGRSVQGQSRTEPELFAAGRERSHTVRGYYVRRGGSRIGERHTCQRRNSERCRYRHGSAGGRTGVDQGGLLPRRHVYRPEGRQFLPYRQTAEH